MAKIRVYKTSLDSRERNRMHARKTRQRKKEHMSALQERCAKLKNDQLRLRQSINEKNTASILLGMFGKSPATDDAAASAASVDAKVDALLKRSVEDIPDASQIPELPALILPGQHSSKKIREAASAAVVAAVSGDEGDAMVATAAAVPPAKPLHPAVNAQGHLPDDGIDYDLLSKDRSKCTPAELDQIRRERNRMHAKRTRDRKRIFMEEMEVMIKQLEEENQALQDHLDSLNANGDANASSSVPASAPISTDTTPSFGPTSPRVDLSASNTPILSDPIMLEDSHQEEVTLTLASLKSSSTGRKRPLPMSTSDGPHQSPSPSSAENSSTNGGGITVDQIKDLLHTAGELDKNSAIAGMLSISSSVASIASPVSVQNSDDDDDDREESEDGRSSKRQRIAPSSAPVPASC